ncbi:hypothetical protein HWV62_16636 [Athelia sp. TMB]|nr:hypothetical protein HWV62_16636 [Athelia sp. TMB]
MNQYRNLVVCIDGTSKKYGEKWTNVLELYSRLEGTEEQERYYQNGIGTNTSLKNILSNALDLAIALNIGRGIQQAYRWLSERYKPGDRIFLFGFSRGAYQVRTLAAMINTVGLVQKGHEEHIPLAYDLYMRKKTAKPDDLKLSLLVENFMYKLSSKVRVHFVGVWDTVSSIGIIRRKTGALNHCENNARFIRHALALGERRVKFVPECILHSDTKERPTNVKEVWFSGSHGDVGGIHSVSSTDTAELKNISLSWMENEAILAGLRLKNSSREWVLGDLRDKLHKQSLKGAWWILEMSPILRPSRLRPQNTTRRLHRGQGRVIYTGQQVHASVAFQDIKHKLKASFLPTEEQQEPGTWQELFDLSRTGFEGCSMNWQRRIEMDMFDIPNTPKLVQELGIKNSSRADKYRVLRRLAFVSSLRGGQRAIAMVSGEVLDRLCVCLPPLGVVEPFQVPNVVADGQIFLATLTLLAKLSSAYTFAISTRSSEKVMKLKEKALSRLLSDQVWTLLGQLVKFMRPGPDELASDSFGEHWAKTVVALAAFDEFRPKLLSKDLMPDLVHMLEVPALRESAVYALGALRVTCEDISPQTELDYAVEHLIKMLPESGAAAAASVLALLSESSKNSPGNFEHVTSKIRGSPEYKDLGKRHQNDKSSSKCVEAILKTLGKSFVNQHEDQYKHTLDSVHKLSESLKNELYAPAALRLVALAPNAIKGKELTEHKVIQRLMAGLETYDSGPAVKALLILLPYADAAPLFLPFIDRLIELLSGAYAALAASLIVKLVQYDGIRTHIVKIDRIDKMLKSLVRSDLLDEAFDVLKFLLSISTLLNHFEQETSSKHISGKTEGSGNNSCMSYLVEVLHKSRADFIFAKRCFEILVHFEDGRQAFDQSGLLLSLASTTAIEHSNLAALIQSKLKESPLPTVHHEKDPNPNKLDNFPGDVLPEFWNLTDGPKDEENLDLLMKKDKGNPELLGDMLDPWWRSEDEQADEGDPEVNSQEILLDNILEPWWKSAKERKLKDQEDIGPYVAAKQGTSWPLPSDVIFAAWWKLIGGGR